MVCDAPDDRLGAACVPGVLPRRRAGRPQRRLRHRLPARRGASAASIAWPRPPVLCTVRLARRVLTRDEAPSVRLSALAQLFGACHHADPPRARRRPRHRRRAARADRAGRQPGRAHLHRPARLSARRDSGAAPQAASGRPALPHRPGRVPVPRPRRRGALRRHRGRSAPPGRSVLQRRRPPHPDQGDGDAGHRGRPRRVRARPGGRRSRAAAARRARAAVQPAVEVPAPLVVGGAHRRGVSRASRWCGRPSSDRAIGPFRSRADAVETAALLARFTGVRTCTTRLGRSALHGPACPERELSPCPAARGVAADRLRRRAAARRRADRRRRRRRARGGARAASTSWPTRSRYETAARLRDHAATAIDVLWRGQRLRALAAVDELVAARPDGDGGWHLAVIRHGQLAAAGTARRGVPPMPVVDAICAGGTSRSADRRAAGRRAGRGDGADRALARPSRACASCGPSPATRSPVGVGGPVGARGRRRRDRRGLAAEQTLGLTGQSFWVNRTQRASSCSAAPESIASAARARPDSHAGTHLASLASPAWATIAPAALSTTASRTAPCGAAEHLRATYAALASASPPISSTDVGALEAERRRVEASAAPRCPPAPARWCSSWWW